MHGSTIKATIFIPERTGILIQEIQSDIRNRDVPEGTLIVSITTSRLNGMHTALQTRFMGISDEDSNFA